MSYVARDYESGLYVAGRGSRHLVELQEARVFSRKVDVWNSAHRTGPVEILKVRLEVIEETTPSSKVTYVGAPVG